MRPRIAKAKSRGSFLGDEFVGRFNGSAKWITQLACVFPVGVVDAPELLAGLQRRARSHCSSSPQLAFVKMYLLHKMRGESVECPVCGHGRTCICPADGRLLHRRRVRKTLPAHLQNELPRDRKHCAAGRRRLPQLRFVSIRKTYPIQAYKIMHGFWGTRRGEGSA